MLVVSYQMSFSIHVHFLSADVRACDRQCVFMYKGAVCTHISPVLTLITFRCQSG